jgi:flavin-binding protein dodecin
VTSIGLRLAHQSSGIRWLIAQAGVCWRIHHLGARQLMSDHVYKIVELVGSSPTSIEDAIQTAIARASSTVDNIRWFEVLETRGHVEGGKVLHYQVTIKVGFTVKA